ncbi:MAG: metal-dependent hydrolase [Gammaproteobacteria bacterium]|nr:metal-dependent hydrolase [Gammaproteobacteria bacterium]MDH3466234.1 metal-dependent hydrolase [Gammaproteobacteria bacterium]
MASPVGHSLIGLAAGHLTGRHLPVATWGWFWFVLLTANAADLDFVPGLLVGDMNRFHHQASHSLAAAAMFGVVVAVVARRYNCSARAWGLSGCAIYASHLAGDVIAADYGAPFGIPLWWPFSMDYVISPIPVFSSIHHGDASDTNLRVLAQIFSAHNLGAIGREIMLIAPLLLGTWYMRRRTVNDRTVTPDQAHKD